METTFVTSFSEDGFEQYGRAFLESFIKHWPYKILVYYENTKPDIVSDQIEYLQLGAVHGIAHFLEATKMWPVMQGYVHMDRKPVYNFNIHKFGRKIFAQWDASKRVRDQLVWIDSDVKITGALPDNWLQSQFDRGSFMLYMERVEVHGCTSFVGWNLNHEQSPGFWNAYIEFLTFGRFLALPQWHDISILECLIENLKLDVFNLAGDKDLPPGNCNVFDAVFDTIAIHNKGRLKKGGPRRYTQLINIVYDRKPRSIVEIGTWNGERALEMAKVNPGADYVGFDLFEDATEATDEAEKNVKPHHTIADVQAKLRRSEFHRATLIRGDTNETLYEYTRRNMKSADLVYIDGGHAVRTIRSDLDAAVNLTKRGGIIVLDDYYEDMPEADLEKWGCNKVLETCGMDFTVLPIADPVKGGGRTKMAIIEF